MLTLLPLLLTAGLATASPADPCQERLQTLQLADHGSVVAVIGLGGVQRAIHMQVIEPPVGHGLRATGRHAELHAIAGHHDDGTAWLKVYRGSRPLAVLNERTLAAGWSGGDPDLLDGVQPIVAALILAATDHVGGGTEALGAAVLDWMYNRCTG
jgi:hypothetical protein